MTLDFVSRLNSEASRDIWAIMRHEAALTLAARELRAYSMVVWNGYKYVRMTYNDGDAIMLRAAN